MNYEKIRQYLKSRSKPYIILIAIYALGYILINVYMVITQTYIYDFLCQRDSECAPYLSDNYIRFRDIETMSFLAPLMIGVLVCIAVKMIYHIKKDYDKFEEK